MKNPRVSRKKEILKIRAEINAKETKETIAKNIRKKEKKKKKKKTKDLGQGPAPLGGSCEG